METTRKIHDHKELLKDIQSKAVLATDVDALAKYKEDREKNFRMDRTERRVSELEIQLREVRTQLQALLAKNNFPG